MKNNFIIGVLQVLLYFLKIVRTFVHPQVVKLIYTKFVFTKTTKIKIINVISTFL